MLAPVRLQPPPAPRHPIAVGLKSRAGIVIGVAAILAALLVGVLPARRSERAERVGTALAVGVVGALIALVSLAEVRRHRRAVATLHRWAASRGWAIAGHRVEGTFEGLPMTIRVGYSRRGHPVALVCEVGGARAGAWTLVNERFSAADDGIAARIDALCAGTRHAEERIPDGIDPAWLFAPDA